MNNRFNFYLPIDVLEKGGEKGEIIIEGRASTPNADKQGDMIDVDGADLDDFLILNDDHEQGTAGVIGEIIKTWKKKDGIYIRGKLYPELPRVQKIVELAKAIKNRAKSKLRLGLSIEGKALQRDPFDKKKVLKSKFFGCAITLFPQNPQTFADIMIKGISYQNKKDLKYESNLEDKDQVLELKRSDGSIIYVDKNFNIKIEKAVTAGNMSGEQLIDKKTTGPSLKLESIEMTPKELVKNLLRLQELGLNLKSMFNDSKL